MKAAEHLIVNIPKDIDSYEKKAILGITIRQFVWVCVSIVVSVLVMVPFMIFNIRSIGFLLGFIVAVGVFMIGGFSTWQGRPYPDFIKAMIRYHRTSSELRYVEQNFDIDDKEGFDERKKTRQDKKINDACSEAYF